MMAKTHPYQFWNDSLNGRRPPIINEMPQCGFYRMKRSGRFVPVAVFLDGEVMRFKINGSMASPEVGIEQWVWFANHPISEAEYRRVAEQGLPWSDMDQAVANHLDTASQPDQVSDFKQQIDSAVQGIGIYSTIEDDAKASQAQSLRSLLLKLAKDADAFREAEKKPHLEEGRKVDKKWRPIIDAAENAARTVRNAIATWETVKLQAHQQAVKLNPETPQSNTPAPSPQVRGAYGKAASVGARQEVTITDIALVFAHFRDHPELHALLTRLAQRATDAGIEVNGISKETKATVR